MSTIDFAVEDLPDVISNAFHGTKAAYANSIAIQGFRLPEDKNIDDPYLGWGVYFYRGDEDAARKFAAMKYRRQAVAVIRATIRVGVAIDLYVRDHREAMVYAESELLKRGHSSVSLGAAIEFITNEMLRHPVHTIRAPQLPKRIPSIRAHFADSKIWGTYAKAMLCVRELSNILSQRIVYIENIS